MNVLLLVLAALFVFLFVRQLILARPGMQLDDAKAALQAGTAVLVDLREPSEWPGTGVAKSASLLPYSDLRGDRVQWGPFLDQHRGRRLLLYCASGMRSGHAANLLRREGHDAVNAGSLRDWDKAGWPVCSPRDR